MCREFTNKELQLLIKFITGSSRLGPNRQIYVSPESEDDSKYPIGHTCGESVDVPNYSTLEIMKERFRTAILTCGEIDDDGDYYGSEYGEESDQNNGEGSSDSSDSNRSDDSDSSRSRLRRRPNRRRGCSEDS